MIEYKGYEIKQAENNHVSVLQDGKKVFHAQCKKKLTENELKGIVDSFIIHDCDK